MSIAFDKRDYYYDGDDLENERADEDEDDDFAVANEQEDIDKVPNEWIYDLYHELRDIANFHAVQLLDKCDVSDFANFMAKYSEDVFAPV
jgi:hypothetical protein